MRSAITQGWGLRGLRGLRGWPRIRRLAWVPGFLKVKSCLMAVWANRVVVPTLFPPVSTFRARTRRIVSAFPGPYPMLQSTEMQESITYALLFCQGWSGEEVLGHKSWSPTGQPLFRNMSRPNAWRWSLLTWVLGTPAWSDCPFFVISQPNA